MVQNIKSNSCNVLNWTVCYPTTSRSTSSIQQLQSWGHHPNSHGKAGIRALREACEIQTLWMRKDTKNTLTHVDSCWFSLILKGTEAHGYSPKAQSAENTKIIPKQLRSHVLAQSFPMAKTDFIRFHCLSEFAKPFLFIPFMASHILYAWSMLRSLSLHRKSHLFLFIQSLSTHSTILWDMRNACPQAKGRGLTPQNCRCSTLSLACTIIKYIK